MSYDVITVHHNLSQFITLHHMSLSNFSWNFGSLARRTVDEVAGGTCSSGTDFHNGMPPWAVTRDRQTHVHLTYRYGEPDVRRRTIILVDLGELNWIKMTYFELQERSFYKILQDLYILKKRTFLSSLSGSTRPSSPAWVFWGDPDELAALCFDPSGLTCNGQRLGEPMWTNSGRGKGKGAKGEANSGHSPWMSCW